MARTVMTRSEEDSMSEHIHKIVEGDVGHLEVAVKLGFRLE